jgi:hypothetical protein
VGDPLESVIWRLHARLGSEEPDFRPAMLRDLLVLRKPFIEFVIRTVFSNIGQGIAGGGGSGAESAFATVLVPGVVVKPLIYVNEGMGEAFTNASHMNLYVVCPVLVGFTALFLGLGLRNFRQRVLS